jgi:hypothetical protein
MPMPHQGALETCGSWMACLPPAKVATHQAWPEASSWRCTLAPRRLGACSRALTQLQRHPRRCHSRASSQQDSPLGPPPRTNPGTLQSRVHRRKEAAYWGLLLAARRRRRSQQSSRPRTSGKTTSSPRGNQQGSRAASGGSAQPTHRPCRRHPRHAPCRPHLSPPAEGRPATAVSSASASAVARGLAEDFWRVASSTWRSQRPGPKGYVLMPPPT